jgi:hypothetical protein
VKQVILYCLSLVLSNTLYTTKDPPKTVQLPPTYVKVPLLRGVPEPEAIFKLALVTVFTMFKLAE